MVVGCSSDDGECDTNASLEITGAITLAAWINPAEYYQTGPVIAKWTDTGDSRSYLLTVGSGGNSVPRFLIDGVAPHNPGAIFNSTAKLRVGNYDDFGFWGVIDDVRVYDEALSAAEVCGLAGKTWNTLSSACE